MDKKTISKVMREMGRRGGRASVQARQKNGKRKEWSQNALKARRRNKNKKA
jgi:hypothetical protein